MRSGGSDLPTDPWLSGSYYPRPGMMDEETLRDALLELDPDGDGEISFEEFEAWYSLNLA
jgi:hypothetical protein